MQPFDWVMATETIDFISKKTIPGNLAKLGKVRLGELR